MKSCSRALKSKEERLVIWAEGIQATKTLNKAKESLLR